MLNTQGLAFIAQDEAMIAFCQTQPNSINYNVSYSGRIESAEEVADIIDKETDNCFKIVCINTITNHVDDITEAVAAAYIKQYGNDLEQGAYVPPFVASSDAWSEHQQYLEAQEAIDAKYGTYEEQHRLRLSDVL